MDISETPDEYSDLNGMFGPDSRFETQNRVISKYSTSRFKIPAPLYRILPLQAKRFILQNQRNSLARKDSSGPVMRWSKFWPLLKTVVYTIVGLIVTAGIFFPSYTHLPPHYAALKTRILQSKEDGRANEFNEKIFVAISLYDKGGHLTGGRWGETVLELLDLIGSKNAFLSIYENGSGLEGTAALKEFTKRVKCPHEIVSEEVSNDDFPTVMLPNGEERLKRLVYLSEIRNRSLRPLDQAAPTAYDKILFLNDVDFYPIEAAHLIFNTNTGTNGRTQYLAACSLDWENPFKFYDLFASRDAEGYAMGIPFFPFFSNAGAQESRSDILAQKDAVRVKSCWSGIVSMQAKYFLSHEDSVPKDFRKIGAHDIDPANPHKVTAPVRFRSEPEIFFDACECCLLMADVQTLAKAANEDTGIYMNPYVRVAYTPYHLSWLPFLRRFERLYSIPHYFVNIISWRPIYNPHRIIVEGQPFQEEVWVRDQSVKDWGRWEIVDRIGRNGLYCGVREMQVIIKDERKVDKNWEQAKIPSGRKFY